MKYAVGMGLGAMIYIPRFIKISSGIQMLMEGRWGIHRFTESMVITKACFNFLKLESMLKHCSPFKQLDNAQEFVGN
jgi:hypothetical protein